MKIIALLMLTSLAFSEDLGKAFSKAEALTLKAIKDHNEGIVDVRNFAGNGHIYIPRGQQQAPTYTPAPQSDPDDEPVVFKGLLSGETLRTTWGEWNALYTPFSKWCDIELMRCAKHQDPEDFIYDSRWARYDLGMRADLAMQFTWIYRKKPHFGPPCN